MYRSRNPEASPFYRVVRDHFADFEGVCGGRFAPRCGYWRTVIRTAIDNYVKCGDLREGFAWVRCPESALTLPKGMRRPGRRPKNDELQRMSRVMITVILSASAFRVFR